MNHNFVFCGQIGSGKTQLSKAVAIALNYRWNSFGATLKNIAVDRGLPVTRASLQALGEAVVSEEPIEFCRRLIGEAHPKEQRPIIVDGLRHQHIYAMLQDLLWPEPVSLIYVDVPDTIRLERLRLRDNLDAEALEKIEKHSTEIQVVKDLRGMADYVADNSVSLSEAALATKLWASAR